jgi:uncharacterized protein (DUF427 family)
LFAKEPGPGQESVWDYPRPPAIRVDQRRVEVRLGDLVIADSRQNYRILETCEPADLLHSASSRPYGAVAA